MLEFQGFPIQQGEVTFYSGKMKVKDLLEFTPEMWSLKNQKGYQRDLSERRAKDYASFIRNKGASPLSILLSVRQVDVILADNEGTVLIDDRAPKYIVDGQHRRRGLEILVAEDQRFGEYEVPVILMNPENRYEEAKQFLVINRTQKGIRPDLAERILQQMIQVEGREALLAQREHGVLRSLYRNVEWNTKALAIADILNRGHFDDGTPITSPWEQIIWLPNELRAGRTVSQKAFTDSLDPIVKAEFLTSESTEFLAQVIANYWNALEELCAQAFDTPDQYGIQKTAGVFILNALLPEAARYTQDSSGRRDLRTPAFKLILEGLGNEILSPGYWQSGGGTIALRGTSKGAQRLLLQEFKEALADSAATTEMKSNLII